MEMRATTTQAQSTFASTSWDEQPYDEGDGKVKLARARTTNRYQGDIEGEGTAEYLIVYGEGGASFVGLERITGRLGGRAGSFVVQSSGADDGTTTRSTLTVVPGSGTGELRGLRGEGVFASTHGQERYPLNLDYHFE
jgi:hypothetical protein